MYVGGSMMSSSADNAMRRMLADLHYGDSPHDAASNQANMRRPRASVRSSPCLSAALRAAWLHLRGCFRAVQVQGRLLDLEHPDIVIFSGDQVSGYAWPGQQRWFAARCAPWSLVRAGHTMHVE